MNDEQMTAEVQEEPVIEAAQAVETTPDPAIEQARAEAKKYGWRPKEEFDLAPDGWVDADRFLELPSTQVKIIRDENKAIRSEAASLKDQLSRISQVTKAQIEREREQARKDYEAKLEDIQRQKDEAAQAHDLDAYNRLTRQERQMRPPAEPQEMPQAPAEVVAYRASERGQWLSDPLLHAEAIEAINKRPDIMALPPQAQLEFAEATMRRNYPDRFPKAEPKPAPRQMVDAGGLAGAAPRKRGAAELPPEAKAAGKELVGDGVFKTIEDYAKAYWAQEN